MTTPASPPLAPFIGMTRARFTPGRPLGAPRVLVIHATAGSHPGDLAWLTRGGGDEPGRAISCHYYIDKRGGVVQLVRDEDTAWHCGPSAWNVDGRRIEGSHQGVARLNYLSIGIELENRNDARDPYPVAQIEAAVRLARGLVQRHRIPPTQLARHLDISPGRKTDPGPRFPWLAFIEAVYPPAPRLYSVQSPLLGAPLGTTEQARRWFATRSTQYDAPAIATIVNAYEREGQAVGVDWFLALAQCAHETGSLSSWWCARPRRNPAGIAVTGDARMGPRPGPNWVLDTDEDVWLEGASFARWDADAVRAHLGRLLAYALPAGAGTPAQQAMIADALAVRPLPPNLRGAALTLQGLDERWAVGRGYSLGIVRRANAMLGAG